MPSSHHVPRPFLLPCPPLQSLAHSNCQLQPPQPTLLDLLPVHHHASLGRYRLARNHSTPFGLPLSGSSPHLSGLHGTSRRVGISMSLLRAEYGERRAENVVARNPTPLSRLVALAACAAFIHCNRLLHALFARPSFDLSATRVTLPRPGSPFALPSLSAYPMTFSFFLGT